MEKGYKGIHAQFSTENLHVFLQFACIFMIKKIPQKWIQSQKYVQGNREVNTYEIKLVGKTHYGAEDIVTAWLNSSCLSLPAVICLFVLCPIVFCWIALLNE